MHKTTSLFFVSLISLGGTVSAHTHVDVVVGTPRSEVVAVNVGSPVLVTTAPPEPIVEVASPCPGDNYIAIPGHWDWNGKWVWRKHEWVVRPSVGAVWEPAHYHYSHHDHAYVWEPGHWR